MRVLVAAAALVTVACGTAINEGPARPEGSVTVFAAASLTDAFKALGRAFEKEDPGVTVKFNFAGTPTLVTQIENGARADVFASADTANMDRLTVDGLTHGDPQVFAHNKLEIAVARGNPKHIASLSDLARPGVIYVSAGPGVPAGRYAAQALTKAGVRVTPKSLEADVRSVLSKVQLGEADAGIVYTTDVKAAGERVTGVAIPDPYNVVASYPLVMTKNAENPVTARDFINFVTSSAGQAVLVSYGFQPA